MAHEILMIVGIGHRATIITVASAMSYRAMPSTTACSLAKLLSVKFARLIAAEAPNIVQSPFSWHCGYR